MTKENTLREEILRDLTRKMRTAISVLRNTREKIKTQYLKFGKGFSISEKLSWNMDSLVIYESLFLYYRRVRLAVRNAKEKHLDYTITDQEAYMYREASASTMSSTSLAYNTCRYYRQEAAFRVLSVLKDYRAWIVDDQAAGILKNKDKK